MKKLHIIMLGMLSAYSSITLAKADSSLLRDALEEGNLQTVLQQARLLEPESSEAGYAIRLARNLTWERRRGMLNRDRASLAITCCAYLGRKDGLEDPSSLEGVTFELEENGTFTVDSDIARYLKYAVPETVPVCVRKSDDLYL